MAINFKILDWNIGGAKYLEEKKGSRETIRNEINADLKDLVRLYRPDVITLQEIVRYTNEKTKEIDNILDDIDGYKYYGFDLIDSGRLSSKSKWNKVKSLGGWPKDTFFAQGNALLFRNEVPHFPIWNLSGYIECRCDSRLNINGRAKHFIEQVNLESGLYFGDRNTEPRAALVAHFIYSIEKKVGESVSEWENIFGSDCSKLLILLKDEFNLDFGEKANIDIKKNKNEKWYESPILFSEKKLVDEQIGEQVEELVKKPVKLSAEVILDSSNRIAILKCKENGKTSNFKIIEKEGKLTFYKVKPLDIFVVNLHLTTLMMEREGIPEIDMDATRIRLAQIDTIFRGVVSRYNTWRQQDYPERGKPRKEKTWEIHERYPPVWIFAGDFNSTPESREYNQIRSMNFIDVVPHKMAGTKASGRGKTATLTLDYIFAGPEFVSLDPIITNYGIKGNYVDNQRRSSDHYPMCATIPILFPEKSEIEQY